MTFKPIYEDTVREGKLHLFPYVVVCEVFEEVIAIFSVFMDNIAYIKPGFLEN